MSARNSQSKLKEVLLLQVVAGICTSNRVGFVVAMAWKLLVHERPKVLLRAAIWAKLFGMPCQEIHPPVLT